MIFFIILDDFRLNVIHKVLQIIPQFMVNDRRFNKFNKLIRVFYKFFFNNREETLGLEKLFKWI